MKSRENWSLWASRVAVAEPGGEGSSNSRAEVEGDIVHLQMMEAQVGLGGSAGSATETMRARKRLKRSMESVNRLTRRLESTPLTADGAIPLDLSCLSSREAVLGPVGPAYSLSGLVVATDGSLRKGGAMGAAYISIGGRLPP